MMPLSKDLKYMLKNISKIGVSNQEAQNALRILKNKKGGWIKVEIKKERYGYYYNYSDFPKTALVRERVITVCYLLTEDGNIGRGISICSRQDTFNEDEGKRIAKYNALRALKHRSIPLIRRREAIDLLIQVKCPFIKKGELNPILSWWEKKFLFGKKGMYKYKYKGGLIIWPPSLYNCRSLINPYVAKQRSLDRCMELAKAV